MIHNLNAMKRTMMIIAVILIILALMIVVFHHLIWVLWMNWFPEKVTLGDTESWQGGTIYEKLPYADDHESQYLDLYIPDTQGKKPLFLLIHGGGFVGNDSQSRQARLMVNYFRDHGFVCASVNYRLAQEAPYPAAVEDVHLALLYLAEHGEEYGIDVSKVAVWGESAGAYLAAREAVTEKDVPITALVAHYGIYDFTSTKEQFRSEGMPRLVVNIANDWQNGLVGDFDSFEEYWLRKAESEWSEEDKLDQSVLHHAQQSADPSLRSLLLHGDADITVPYDQSYLLRDVLTERCGSDHVTMELIHGYSHASDGFYSDERLSDIEAFLREALDME